jgi:polysaccharide biosynthesis protein PslG
VFACISVAIVAMAPLTWSGGASAGWIKVRPHVASKHASRTERRRTTTSRAADVSAGGTAIALGGAIQNEPAATQGRDFDTIAAAGAHWIRMDVNWDVVQHDGPTSYNWAPFDGVVRAARARGLDVLATIVYTPPWARPAGTAANTPPVSIAAYAEFARAAATRYGPLGVHAYEIWNEPNNASFWAPRADAARYTELLTAAASAVRAADAKAFVVTGGMSPALDAGGNIAPVTFLEDVYAHGGKASFDAVGHHPYCWPAMPGDAEWWSAWHQMAGAPKSLRSVMAANGDAGKQIWATEFGAPTDGPAGAYVDEAAQAHMVTRAYKLFESYPWAGPLFWYAARDLGTSRSTRENFFGLLHNDFSPKPAYAAFRALSART